MAVTVIRFRPMSTSNCYAAMAAKQQTSNGTNAVPSERIGARMTDLEAVRLGMKLQGARSNPEPVPWATLSRQFGLPVRTLQYHWRRHKDRAATFTDLSGMKILCESAHLQDKLLEKVMEEVDHADNSSARVGAIRLAEHLLERRIELWYSRYDEASFQARSEELTKLAEAFKSFLEDDDVPLEVLERFAKFGDQLLGNGRTLELVARNME